MNFSQLLQEASLVDPTDAISIKVETWRHTHPGAVPKLEWVVWSNNLRQHFQSPEPENALAQYKLAFASRTFSEPLEVQLSRVDVESTPIEKSVKRIPLILKREDWKTFKLTTGEQCRYRWIASQQLLASGFDAAKAVVFHDEGLGKINVFVMNKSEIWFETEEESACCVTKLQINW